MTLRERMRIDEWDSNRILIAICAASMFLMLLWASLARIDEITRGMGKVVP